MNEELHTLRTVLGKLCLSRAARTLIAAAARQEDATVYLAIRKSLDNFVFALARDSTDCLSKCRLRRFLTACRSSLLVSLVRFSFLFIILFCAWLNKNNLGVNFNILLTCFFSSAGARTDIFPCNSRGFAIRNARPGRIEWQRQGRRLIASGVRASASDDDAELDARGGGDKLVRVISKDAEVI